MEPERVAGGGLRTIGAAVAITVAGVVGASAVTVGAVLVVVFASARLDPFALFAVGAACAGLGFGAVALGYVRHRGVGLEYVGVRVPSLRDAIAVVSGYVLAFVALFVGVAIVTSLTTTEPAERGTDLGQVVVNPEVLTLVIVAFFVFTGPGEELLFRGVVQNRIKEGFGPVVAIVLTSVLFAEIHFAVFAGAASGRLVAVSVLFFPSLVFGAAYELTDNIVVPAFVHAAYNATLATLVYLLSTV